MLGPLPEKIRANLTCAYTSDTYRQEKRKLTGKRAQAKNESTTNAFYGSSLTLLKLSTTRDPSLPALVKAVTMAEHDARFDRTKPI